MGRGTFIGEGWGSACGRLAVWLSAISAARCFAAAHDMADSSLFVYMLRRERFPDRYYTGVINNVARRLEVHNSGGSQHSSELRPWKLVVSLQFENGANSGV